MSFDRDLAKDTINYGVGQILPKVISFLLIPVYVAYLSPVEFGLIELVTSIGLFLTISMRFSLPGSVTRFYFDFDNPKDISRYISTIYFSIVGISALMTVAFAATFWFFGEALVPDVSFYPLFAIILASSFLNSSSELQRRLLQVRRKSAYNAYLNFATTLVGVLVTILLVVVFKMGALGAILSILVTSIVFFIQAQIYLQKDIELVFDKAFLIESLKYCMPLFIYHCLGSFAPMMSRSLLAGEVSMAALGIFAMAYKMTQPLTVFYTAFASAYTPLYYALRTKNDDQASVRQVKESFSKVWGLAVILFLTVLVFSKPFLFFLPDKTYIQGDLVLKILAFGSLPTIFYLIISNEIFYQKKTRIALFLNLLSIVLTIGFSVLLVKPLKEMGIALSLVIPGVLNAVLAYFFARRYHTVVIDWGFFFKSIAIATIVALVVVFPLGDVSMTTMILLSLLYLMAISLILILEKSLIVSGLKLVRKLLDRPASPQ